MKPQCVVIFLPRVSPAAESNSEPVQTLVTQVQRSLAGWGEVYVVGLDLVDDVPLELLPWVGAAEGSAGCDGRDRALSGPAGGRHGLPAAGRSVAGGRGAASDRARRGRDGPSHRSPGGIKGGFELVMLGSGDIFFFI